MSDGDAGHAEALQALESRLEARMKEFEAKFKDLEAKVAKSNEFLKHMHVIAGKLSEGA